MTAIPAAAQPLGHGDVRDMAAVAPDAVDAYGEDEHQYGELRLPAGDGPFPVAVLVHGGFWTKSIGATLEYLRPMASALAAHGIATWTIEYRQVGDDGGGWPGSFEDWADGTDYLRTLARRYPLDLDRVTLIGHSAGAHAALWLAGRTSISRESELARASVVPLPVRAVISLDGPGDLETGRARAAEICGLDGIVNVMGGTPEEVPQRYASGSPSNLLPLGVKQLVVASVIMPPDQGEAWMRAAEAAGDDDVSLIRLQDSGHFDMLAPGTPTWEMLLPRYLQTIRGEDSE